jgi:hypothetical protein
MTIITKNDKHKYISNYKQIEREKVHHGSGLVNLHIGGVLYVPKKEFYNEGNGIGDIISWIGKNSDTIKNVASTVGSVADVVGKIGSSTVDIIKKVKELKNQNITNNALEEVLQSKKGSGFLLIDK